MYRNNLWVDISLLKFKPNTNAFAFDFIHTNTAGFGDWGFSNGGGDYRITDRNVDSPAGPCSTTDIKIGKDMVSSSFDEPETFEDGIEMSIRMTCREDGKGLTPSNRVGV